MILIEELELIKLWWFVFCRIKGVIYINNIFRILNILLNIVFIFYNYLLIYEFILVV